jgi:hypothetical protein
MTDAEKIAHLNEMLQQPEGKYTHDQIRAKLNQLVQGAGEPAVSGPGMQQPAPRPAPPAAAPEEPFGERMSRGAHRLNEEVVKPALSTVNNYTDKLLLGLPKREEKNLARVFGRELPDESAYGQGGNVVRGAEDAAALLTPMGMASKIAEKTGEGVDALVNVLRARKAVTSAPGVVPAAARVIARGGAGAAKAGLAAGGVRAGESLVAGNDPETAGRDALSAATDPKTLALGAGLGTAQGLSREAAGAAREASPDLQLLDKHGLEPGPIPGRPIIRKDQPVLGQEGGPPTGVRRATPATRGAAARAAGDTIESDLDASEKANNKRYGELKADALVKEGMNPVPMAPTVQLIDRHLADVGLNPATRAHLTHLREQIMGRPIGNTGVMAGGIGIPTKMGVFGRVHQVDRLRDLADEFGRQGKLAGANDIPLRQTADELRKAVEAGAPQLTALNKTHHGLMSGLEERRALVGDPENQGASFFAREREGGARSARIRQAGEETATGGGQETDMGDRMERLASLGTPQLHAGATLPVRPYSYQDLIEQPRLQLAQEDLQLSPSKLFSGTRSGPGMLHRAAEYIPMRLGYPAIRRLGDSDVGTQPMAADALVSAIRGRKKKEENANAD